MYLSFVAKFLLKSDVPCFHKIIISILLYRVLTEQIVIPNTVSQAWDPQDIVTFTHECDWDSTETLSSTCPNGTDIITVCAGTALVRLASTFNRRLDSLLSAGVCRLVEILSLGLCFSYQWKLSAHLLPNSRFTSKLDLHSISCSLW